MPDRGIPIFAAGDRLTFSASVEGDPAALVVTEREWHVSEGWLLLAAAPPRHVVRLSPAAVVLAARGGLFGLSFCWGEVRVPLRILRRRFSVPMSKVERDQVAEMYGFDPEFLEHAAELLIERKQPPEGVQASELARRLAHNSAGLLEAYVAAEEEVRRLRSRARS